MQTLKPLKQWICDVCQNVIEQPEHGFLEWREDFDHKKFGFRIVHHQPHSPNRSKGRDCYYTNNERGGDNHLTDFVGVHGLVYLTSWIDAGKEFDEKYRGPSVRDLREWTTLLRRLHVPYYEEARFYFAEAHADSNLGNSNELYFYLPHDGLKEILATYRDNEG